MKWLTIPYIKTHSRIDFDCEDSLLEQYGESAEATLLELMRRTYDSLIDEYGSIPAPLYEAAQMLVTLSYEHRSPVDAQSLSVVPYAIDLKLKPLMRLAGPEAQEYERDLLIRQLSDLQADFALCVADLDMIDLDEETRQDIDEIAKDIADTLTKYGQIERVTPLVCRRLRQQTAALRERTKTYITE